jgi:hypothetical protein
MRLVVAFPAALCLLLAGGLAYTTAMMLSYKAELDARRKEHSDFVQEREVARRRWQEMSRRPAEQWRQVSERQRELERLAKGARGGK